MFNVIKFNYSPPQFWKYEFKIEWVQNVLSKINIIFDQYLANLRLMLKDF